MSLHTRIHGDEHYQWPRVLCGARGKKNKDSGTLSRSIPTCPTCSVLRDMWLEAGIDKTPTIRRWRAFLDTHPDALALVESAGHKRT